MDAKTSIIIAAGVPTILLLVAALLIVSMRRCTISVTPDLEQGNSTYLVQYARTDRRASSDTTARATQIRRPDPVVSRSRTVSLSKIVIPKRRQRAEASSARGRDLKNHITESTTTERVPPEIISIIAEYANPSTLFALRSCSKQAAYACDIVFKAQFHTRNIKFTATSLQKLVDVSLVTSPWQLRALVRKLSISISMSKRDANDRKLRRLVVGRNSDVRCAIQRYMNCTEIEFVDGDESTSDGGRVMRMQDNILTQLWLGLKESAMPLSIIQNKKSQIPLPLSMLPHTPSGTITQACPLQHIKRMDLLLTLKTIEEANLFAKFLNAMPDLSRLNLRIDHFGDSMHATTSHEHLISVKLVDGLFRVLANEAFMPKLKTLLIKTPVGNTSHIGLFVTKHARTLRALGLSFGMPWHETIEQMRWAWSGVGDHLRGLDQLVTQLTWYRLKLPCAKSVRLWRTEDVGDKAQFFDNMLEDLMLWSEDIRSEWLA